MITPVITFSPSQEHTNEVREWLRIENKIAGKGFYDKWDIIESSISGGQSAMVLVKGKPIGFITWSEDRYVAKIEYSEIKPDQRKKGFGKILTDEVCKYLAQRNIYVVHLECAPIESEPAWRKLGFANFPQNSEGRKFEVAANKHLYKIIVPYAEANGNNDGQATVELWNNNPRLARNDLPTWTWHVSNEDQLDLPIIQPGHYTWRIRITNGAKILHDDEVRRFKKGRDFGDFIIFSKSLSDS